jgi:dsRNA-specific ribonuclease
MVEELKKLPPLSPVEETPKVNLKGRRTKPQQQTPSTVSDDETKTSKNLISSHQQPPIKKKSRNLIKEKLETPNGDEINPISQLIQIQQSRKEKEPVYTVIEERGTARRREFVIEVSAGGITASGTGPNKKQAKRIAAESELKLKFLKIHNNYS